MATIPIIDVSALRQYSNSKKDVEIDRIVNLLDEAFSNVGFVFLTNHGIDQEKISAVFKASKDFFELPVDVKNLSRRDFNKSNDGYVGIDQEMLGTNNMHEIKEAYNATSTTSMYPKEIPEFQSAIIELATNLCDLTRTLLKCIALALNVEEDFFSSRHKFMFEDQGKNASTFRTLYYPSLSDNDIQPGVVRCGAHSDYGTITLLLQDNVGGLEVLSGSTWTSATPIPGSILVNLGDLMQFWTSGRYVATVHRVLVPEEEIRRKTHRQSIAFFVHPDNDVMVSPINGSGDIPPVGALEYLKKRLSATYNY